MMDFEARICWNSGNSSKPPASDIVYSRRPKPSPRGRKPGGQPGREAHNREQCPSEKADFRNAGIPPDCRH